MGEKQAADGVADGVDRRLGGAIGVVDCDPAPLYLNGGLLDAQALGDGPAADGDSTICAFDGLLDSLSCSTVSSTTLSYMCVLSGKTRADVMTFTPRAASDFPSALPNVGVFQRHDRRQHLDERHLAADVDEERRELAANRAGADDEDRLRQSPRAASRWSLFRMRSPSTSRPGMSFGWEPVAMTMFFAVSVRPLTATWVGETRRPSPSMISILCF